MIRSPRNAPRLSVVIPAYDQPLLLKAALTSLARQGNALDFEVVITDDLGLRETQWIVDSCGLPHVRYARNPVRLGAVANWNEGLRLARGEWITILHEDDLLLDGCFARVAEYLRPGVTALAVRCASGSILPAGRAAGQSRRRPRRYRPEHFLKSAMTPFPGVFLRREAARDLGGFDDAWGPLADYEFWYRLGCYGPVWFLPETFAFYRVRENQWTARAWPEMIRRTHLLRLAIAREQFPAHPRLGRWLARFFTSRNVDSYARRFTGGSTSLHRGRALGRIPARCLPSGWVWLGLRGLAWAGRPPADISHSNIKWQSRTLHSFQTNPPAHVI